MTVMGPLLPAKFKGDGDLHLDALVAACAQALKPVDLPKDFVGRELQPFVFEDSYGAVDCYAKAKRVPCAKQIGAVLNAKIPSPPRGANGNNYNNSKGPSPAHLRGATVRGGNRPKSPPSPSPSLNSRDEAVHRPSRGSLDATPVSCSGTPSGATFRSLGTRAELEALLRSPCGAPSACPGFFSSPRPEEMPRPSNILLLRAGSVCVKA